MIDWLTGLLAAITWHGALLWSVMFLATFLLNLALVSFVLVKLPSTYFQLSHSREFLVDRHHLMRWSGLFLKNVIGLLMVVLGVIMSVPGVPGSINRR
jgi:hypothetical protein